MSRVGLGVICSWIAVGAAALPSHAQVQFTQQGAKLTASGAVGVPNWGSSVAISADGNTAIIGGPLDNNGAGAAWVFTRTNGVWTQQGAKLIGSNAIGAAHQGFSVALSANGNIAVIGGPADNAFKGAVWVFTRANGVWTQQGPKLVGTGAVTAGQQGFSVAISADGTTIAWGAPFESGVGAVWVSIRTLAEWLPQGTRLIGGDAVGPAQIGYSLALSGDGSTFIVGGIGDNGSKGAAWFFARNNGVWSQQGSKVAGTGTAAGAQQGFAVGISTDGGTAIESGPLENGGEGGAWVFTRANGVWTQQGGKLVGSGAVGGALQGTAVGLSADGNTTLLAGDGDSTNAGAAWIFTRNNGVWTQFGNKLVGTGAEGLAAMGVSAALSGDATTVIAGGPFDNRSVGAAWVFAKQTLTPPPSVVSLSPAASSGANQILTVTYSAPGGYQTLDVVNLLINTALDGRQACYLAYSRPTNTLYIVADSGDPAQLTGKVMDGTGTVANSQCTVTLAGSSATGSGNTLTLVLNLSFAASFAGNRVIYAAARDAAQSNSGWQTVGVHAVPPIPAASPNAIGVSPASGTGLTQTFTFTYQDQVSATNLQTVWGLINTAIDGRNACYFAYYRPGNQLFLYPDNGDGAQAANIVLTGSNTISNNQCTISAQGASAQTSGGTLTLTLPITFKTAFAGFKGIWMAAQTIGGAQTSAWQALGAWVVPGQ